MPLSCTWKWRRGSTQWTSMEMEERKCTVDEQRGKRHTLSFCRRKDKQLSRSSLASLFEIPVPDENWATVNRERERERERERKIKHNGSIHRTSMHIKNLISVYINCGGCVLDDCHPIILVFILVSHTFNFWSILSFDWCISEMQASIESHIYSFFTTPATYG